MTARAAADVTALVGAYDFTRFATIADRRRPRAPPGRGARGRACGARRVVRASEVVAALDVRARAGDRAGRRLFARPSLPAAEPTSMDVMHDWPDVQCLAILARSRRAAVAGATVPSSSSRAVDGDVRARADRLRNSNNTPRAAGAASSAAPRRCPRPPPMSAIVANRVKS